MNETAIQESEVHSLLASIIKDENVINYEIKIDVGSEKGANFMSFLKRVDIVGDNKELHLMLKCAPRLEKIRTMAPIRAFFSRELFFYEEVIPIFRKFQNSHKIERPFKSYPKCFKTHSKEGEEYIVLENITENGFRLWNRQKRMNEDHLSYIFKNYGKFHAISYAIKDQQPNIWEYLSEKMEPLFSSDVSKASDMMLAIISNAEKMCNLFKDNDQYYKPLIKLKDGILEFFKSIKMNPGKFAVIAHGDCWCNNMMFKYEDSQNPGTPIDICLLDFQLSQMSSPVLDLSYVFLVSASKNTLNEYKSYLKLYYDSLKSHYESLGGNSLKLLSFNDLLSEWNIYSKFGFIMSLIILPVMLCNDNETEDLTYVENESSRLSDVFTRDLSNDDAINLIIKDLAVFMLENNLV